MKADAKVEVDLEAAEELLVTRADFLHALKNDVKPALGSAEDLLQVCNFCSSEKGIIQDSGQYSVLATMTSNAVEHQWQPLRGLRTITLNTHFDQFLITRENQLDLTVYGTSSHSSWFSFLTNKCRQSFCTQGFLLRGIVDWSPEIGSILADGDLLLQQAASTSGPGLVSILIEVQLYRFT